MMARRPSTDEYKRQSVVRREGGQTFDPTLPLPNYGATERRISRLDLLL